jgi:2-haloacid dehalogenase
VAAWYRDALDRLLEQDGIGFFSESEREDLALSWQKTVAWPDAVDGLTRLKTRFTLATLSNADVAAVVNLSKRAGLPWDAIFTAGIGGSFQTRSRGLPQSRTPPNEIMMVACHKYDIRAAASLGFRTAFVARPLEFGVEGEVDVQYEDEFDMNAGDFLDLARQLGC